MLLLSIGAAACTDSAPTGQVIARVDGKEVTSAQLDQQLDRAQNPQDPAVRAATAQSLIDETLFAAAAEDAGLQKDPRIAREIDSARRAILARALLAKIAPPSPVGDAEIAQFYRDNAAQFGERRRYAVTDIVARGGAELTRYVKPLGETITLEALESLLRQRGVAVETRSFSFLGDAVSPRMAAQFGRLSVGSTYSFREGPTRHFGRIDQVENAPVAPGDAANTIRGAIIATRIEKAARDKLAALRADDKVVLGELGKTILAGQGRTEALDVTPARPSDASRSRAIERGLSGL